MILAAMHDGNRTFVAPISTLGRSPCKEHLLTAAGSVKVVRINILTEHDVVVQVQKLAADSWNAVQVRLDGGRRKRGQMGLVREYCFVGDNAEERGVTVTARGLRF